MEQSLKRLIVNADDFGLTESVTRGIIDCHEAGALRSTTLMTGSEAAPLAAQLAAACPGLGVGVHVNLTSGRPLLPAAEVPSLVDAAGRFPGLAGAIWRLTSGRARRAELEAEVRAQIARCRELGIEPTHIDSHHHLHAHPRLRSLLQSICPGLGITRARGYHVAERGPKALAIALAAKLPAMGKSLQTPDMFFGIGLMGRKDVTGPLSRELARDGGTLEFMCHPGYADARLAQITSYNQPRQAELEWLLSGALADVVRAAGVELIGFGDL